MQRREFIALLGASATWPIAGYAQQPGKIFRIGFPWSATQPSMRLARCSVVIKISSAKINCGQRKNTSSSSSRFLTSRSPSCCRLVNGSAGDWLRARC